MVTGSAVIRKSFFSRAIGYRRSSTAHSLTSQSVRAQPPRFRIFAAGLLAFGHEKTPPFLTGFVPVFESVRFGSLRRE